MTKENFPNQNSEKIFINKNLDKLPKDPIFKEKYKMAQKTLSDLKTNNPEEFEKISKTIQDKK